MHIFVCDEVFNRLVLSLVKKIQLYYEEDSNGKLCIIAAGKSGIKVADQIYEKISGGEIEVALQKIDVGLKGKEVKNISLDKIKGKHILICDSIVDTGTTLLNLRDYFLKFNVQSVKTLTIFLRNNAKIVPNFYATLIDEDDKVFYNTEIYPVGEILHGHIRKLTREDSGKSFKPTLSCIDKDMDAYIYAQMIDKTCKTYIIEDDKCSKIIGILKFYQKKNEVLLDVLAIDEGFRKQGYSSEIYKFFIEDYCKFNHIKKVRLWSHESAVSYWKKLNYEETKKTLDFGKYGKMKEMILGNISHL